LSLDFFSVKSFFSPNPNKITWQFFVQTLNDSPIFPSNASLKNADLTAMLAPLPRFEVTLFGAFQLNPSKTGIIIISPVSKNPLVVTCIYVDDYVQL